MQRRPIAQRRSLGHATTMTVKISASSAPSRLRRVMVLSASVLAAAVFELNLTNISVVLPHMQGAFSATQDQVSWVVTAFFVGMIVGFARSGWAADRFGRKQVFMLANLGFVVATFMCGASDTLGSEVAWRFGQGFWGGPRRLVGQALRPGELWPALRVFRGPPRRGAPGRGYEAHECRKGVVLLPGRKMCLWPQY